jgi:hypothetical protein
MMIRLNILALVLLAGCAVNSPQPQRPLTLEQAAARNKLRQDDAACKFDAARSVQRSQTGYSLSSAIMDETNDSMQRANLYNLCMQARGYGNS